MSYIRPTTSVFVGSPFPLANSQTLPLLLHFIQEGGWSSLLFKYTNTNGLGIHQPAKDLVYRKETRNTSYLDLKSSSLAVSEFCSFLEGWAWNERKHDKRCCPSSSGSPGILSPKLRSCFNLFPPICRDGDESPEVWQSSVTQSCNVWPHCSEWVAAEDIKTYQSAPLDTGVQLSLMYESQWKYRFLSWGPQMRFITVATHLIVSFSLKAAFIHPQQQVAAFFVPRTSVLPNISLLLAPSNLVKSATCSAFHIKVLEPQGWFYHALYQQFSYPIFFLSQQPSQ